MSQCQKTFRHQPTNQPRVFQLVHGDMTCLCLLYRDCIWCCSCCGVGKSSDCGTERLWLRCSLDVACQYCWRHWHDTCLVWISLFTTFLWGTSNALLSLLHCVTS